MSGIRNALLRVADGKNVGTVRAIGMLHKTSQQESDTKYMIIELGCNNGRITVYDYGSDIRIAKDLKVGDVCMLMIKDNWSAEWVKKSNETDPKAC